MQDKIIQDAKKAMFACYFARLCPELETTSIVIQEANVLHPDSTTDIVKAIADFNAAIETVALRETTQ